MCDKETQEFAHPCRNRIGVVIRDTDNRHGTFLMAHIQIPIVLPNGLTAYLMFRRHQSGGDWICRASDECIFDLQTLLEGVNITDTVQ